MVRLVLLALLPLAACATTERTEGSYGAGGIYSFSIGADTPDTVLHVIANTDVAWTGGTPHAELDDPNWVSGSGFLGTDVAQILVTTNGDITITELAGDLLAGHIHSTNADVTLTSPEAILDADGQPTVDVTGENITMTDVDGVLHEGRGDIDEFRAPFARPKGDGRRTLADAMVDCDVMIGLSAGNVVTPAMLKTMAKKPIIFALANPDPEIAYPLAVETRPDALIATASTEFSVPTPS